ncbi:hypothetical protein [Desulforhopalus singaporensis]|uniref:Uncharacterized protein n=1 Tax=Desulforhopalus singaporensis TaxID=91360 RepID=A0A1H0NTM4_9BACT|nr:hypothetical protein [Desulforhopalus singaporensis]SDO96023.1 hypothetical protein SAMN05660330_01440 [Desulforhopalus singaporensis]
MYKYENAEGTVVSDLMTGRSNITPSSRFWADFQEWLAKGNTPEAFRTQEELDAITALETRVAELEAERNAAGIRDITPQQAKDWIDNEFASASTNPEIVAVIKKILKKIVVFLLR